MPKYENIVIFLIFDHQMVDSPPHGGGSFEAIKIPVLKYHHHGGKISLPDHHHGGGFFRDLSDSPHGGCKIAQYTPWRQIVDAKPLVVFPHGGEKNHPCIQCHVCPEVNPTRYSAQMDRKDAPKMLDWNSFERRVESGFDGYGNSWYQLKKENPFSGSKVFLAVQDVIDL